VGRTTSKIALIAALSTIWPTFASSQQGGAGAPATSTNPVGTTSVAAPAGTSSTLPNPNSGQQGGLQIDIGVSSTIKNDSNFQLTPGKTKGSTQFLDNRLSFGVSSVTSAYSLNVVGTGDLRYSNIPGATSFGFEDPTLKFDFVADSANSRLTLNGQYRNVDRNFLNPFQVEQETQTLGQLVGSGGKLRNTKLGLKYETGLNDPLGFVLDLKHDDKSYSGVVNPLIFDNLTDEAKATVLMRVNPVTSFNLNAGVKHYTATDLVQTDRTTTDYSIGVVYDINPVLLMDAQIGYTDVKTDTIFGTVQRNGVVGSVSLTKTLANGTIFGTLATTRNQLGARTSLSFGRDLQLLNGNLRGSFGLTRGSNGNSKTIGSLAYAYQLPSSTITVSFNRSASTNNSNQDILNTRIGLGYNHLINNVSRVNVTLDFGRSEDVGSTGGPTIDLTNLDVSYSRDLTSDWSLTGGATLRKRTETGLADAKSTAFYLTLGRNFSFRP
jgi:hypothetical protein